MARPGGGARAAGLRDRRRRLQPRAAVAGRRARHGPAGARGHGVPRGGAGVSGAHGRVLLVDAHRGHAGRARNALQLRASARRSVRVGLRRARTAWPQRPARGDRAPAGSVRRGRGPVRHVGAAHRRDRPLADRRGAPRGRGGGPGPARAPAAGGRPARPRARRAEPRVPRPARGDRPPRRRFPRLPRGARQARRRDCDPHGRPRPGPRHRRPRPPRLGRAAGAVRRLGPRRRAGRGLAPSRARSSSWRRRSPICSESRHRRAPAAARSCPRRRVGRSCPQPGAKSTSRCSMSRDRRRARRGGGRRRGASRAAGGGVRAAVDVLLVDDGSRDATPDIGRELGARVVSHPVCRGLGAALRTGLEMRSRRGIRRRRLHRR